MNDEQALKKAVANQPVSVAIEAGGRSFQLYTSVKQSSSLLQSPSFLAVRMAEKAMMILGGIEVSLN